tara:strand:+ start:579 stop:779 length:201 start_codon:yes stop_codon:yes gene_type:complete
MQLNNAISHNKRIIFELSNVAKEIQELEAKFGLLELYDIEKAIKKIKSSIRDKYKKPTSDVFSVTI